MGLFNRYINPGKGIRKEDIEKKFGFRRFFSVFADKFWKLVTLNLLFFLINLPLFGIFAYFAGVGGEPFSAPTNVLYAPLYGVMLHGENPVLQALHGVVGVQVEHSTPTLLTNGLLCFGLLSVFTFGISSAAMTYIQRNFVKGTPVDLGDDFFHCIKKNWKQSILLGIVDLIAIFIICYDLISYVYVSASFGFLLLRYATIFISLLYLMMRPFMYLISITFDLKIGKIIKNSCILVAAGIGRGLLCGLAALAVLVLNVIVFNFIPSLGVGMLFIFTISIAWFFQVFGAWPVIKKHMIDPFYEETVVSEEETEAVFQDRG
ncbi:MAG: DUF624 domain-containing protein [Clostridia bacterium]|nr:DUF624 domain-containing protein [Clostridia bacterium]